jgi:hypothetical protein
MSAVNRVHWIRARAQKNRWQEELTLTGYEMQWTVRYFHHQAGTWEKWGIQAADADKPGAAAYAARKVVMWTQLRNDAERRFTRTSGTYEPAAQAAGLNTSGTV